MVRRVRAVLLLTLGVAAPSVAALAILIHLGFLAITPGLLAGAAILLVTGLVVLPFAAAMDGLQRAFRTLEDDAVAPLQQLMRLPTRANPAGALWRSLRRQNRAWRERIVASEARLAAAEAVIAAAPDPLILIDRQRRIVRANIAAEPFVGRLTEPRDLATALRNPELLTAADAVLRGDPSSTVEFGVAVPVERVLRAHIAAMGGPALDGAAAILSLSDITALKRAEEMRADFIANAGHELKTPLATLAGFIETLLGPAREDAPARERFLGIMREQTGRMTRLVSDMLSLSRIELNEHVPPTGRIAVRPLIEQVAAGLELRAAERGIRIALSVPPELPEVPGDPDELAQLFQNLIDNAIKYGRPESQVTVTAEAGGGPMPQLRVTVADQGDGIPAEHLPRLTERFYRVDNARSRALGGTGLGLAIVKHILNRHRGRLEITSTLGRGSCFTVSLPAAEAAVIER